MYLKNKSEDLSEIKTFLYL